MIGFTSMNKNKRVPILLALLGVALLLVFISLAYITLTSGAFINRPLDSLKYEDEQVEPDEPEKISETLDLKDKTPYQGSYFSFTFDENEGLFYVYIDPTHESEGNKEFNEFLKQNGIPDRSYFPYLETSSVPVPTPGP